MDFRLPGHLIRRFYRHFQLSVPKFQNDIAVDLQLHPDAFASAKCSTASFTIRQEDINSPTLSCAVSLYTPKDIPGVESR